MTTSTDHHKHKHELSRVSSGVYQIACEQTGEPIWLSGRLHFVIERAKAISGKTVPILYLHRPDPASAPQWREVKVDRFEHYYGEQQKALLAWMYQLDCPKSQYGHARFAKLVGLTPSRIADALRNAASRHHKPLSSSGMQFIERRVTDIIVSRNP